MTPTDTTAKAAAAAASAPPTSGAGALVRSGGSEISAGVFSGIAAFEAAQRMAQCLCSSTMVPTEYRGQQGLANSLIALEIAGRMGLSPLVVMQNMTPIHGRPSWSSSFLIATVNASARFTPLRFQFDDEENPNWCYAEACDRSSGETLKGEKISIAMAKREGWWSRKDRHGNETSKWQSMTGQMLRYRAAAFWVRVYCPEMSLGLTTQEEALDANSPAAAVETVTVREVPLAKGSGTGGAVPQPIRPMSVVDQPAAAEVPPGGEAAPQETAAASSSAAPIEPEAQAAPRTRRSSSRTRRSFSGPDEAGPETGAAAVPPSEPGAAEAEEQEAEPMPLQTPELGAHQELLPELASAVTAASVAEEPEPLEPGAGIAAASSAEDVTRSGLQEIPKIASLQALDGAKARVNALLASGRINEDGAERLWEVIDRRRRQLQAAAEAEAKP